jgi:regulator of ribonuclease activity A
VCLSAVRLPFVPVVGVVFAEARARALSFRFRRENREKKKCVFVEETTFERAMSWCRAWRAGARMSRAVSRDRAFSAFECPGALAAVSEPPPAHEKTSRLLRDGVFRRSFASSASPGAGDASSNAAPMHGFDPERGGLAELTDVFHPEPVDAVGARSMQFVEAGYLRDFGGVLRFSGPASTVRCFENNPLVREALNEPGRGRVLVVDGGGSRRCALLGDNLAGLAATNGWAGVVINGCLRDAADIGSIPIGVKAIAPHPLKSSKRDPGVRDVPVSFAGVTVTPGDWVYADMDGVIVGGKEKFQLR